MVNYANCRCENSLEVAAIVICFAKENKIGSMSTSFLYLFMGRLHHSGIAASIWLSKCPVVQDSPLLNLLIQKTLRDFTINLMNYLKAFSASGLKRVFRASAIANNFSYKSYKLCSLYSSLVIRKTQHFQIYYFLSK